MSQNSIDVPGASALNLCFALTPNGPKNNMIQGGTNILMFGHKLKRQSFALIAHYRDKDSDKASSALCCCAEAAYVSAGCVLHASMVLTLSVRDKRAAEDGSRSRRE